MMLIRFIRTATWVGLMVATSWAALPKDGGMEGDFLSWGAGARSSALGKAYVALASDATATYWNPAGLAWMNRTEGTALHSLLWEGLSYDYLSVAFPTLDQGSFGFFGALLSVGGVERRDSENNVVAGDLGMTKSALGASYALEIITDLSVGATLKHIGRSVDAQQSGFFTADLGFRWIPIPRLFVGGVIQHGLAIRYGDTEDTLPGKIRLGAAYQWAGLGSIGLDFEGNGRWHLGAESLPVGPLVGRVGADIYGMSAGLGIGMDDWKVDYSANLHSALGTSHWISFSVEWGDSIFTLRRSSALTAYEEAVEAFAKGDVDTAKRALEISLKYDIKNETARRMLEALVK